MNPDISSTRACRLCPRDCGAPRTPAHPGWCGSDEGFPTTGSPASCPITEKKDASAVTRDQAPFSFPVVL
ncbi:MAG: hypothetical protein GX838_02965 [Clostridiaceae bacterium]|nr:hypothetical protein [Clostridiaceae bacterium]